VKVHTSANVKTLELAGATAPDARWDVVTKGSQPMGLDDLFEGSHAIILILVIVALFGWKRLPDAARGLGRSIRIFKSEMNEMNSDGKGTSTPSGTEGAVQPTARPADDPSDLEQHDHNQPPA
jgi:sec-independent protein translocase protein TatA